MADRYTSKIALVLNRECEPVDQLVERAVQAGDIDRATAVRGDGVNAVEVNWGGRMQRAVVRRITEDDRHLLRVEAYIGDLGPKRGGQRQAALVQGLLRHVAVTDVEGVADLDAEVDHPLSWVHRSAVSGWTFEEAVTHRTEGTGTHWAHTHGAARFDVPDLELYGLTASQAARAEPVLRHVHAQLHAGGLKTDLRLPDDRPVYLVPVLQAWQHCDLEWPGVGRAGKPRGPGLDGPRATLSLLHRPRFGRYRVDLEGVREAL